MSLILRDLFQFKRYKEEEEKLLKVKAELNKCNI